MVLTDYYRFVKDATRKAETRLDCVVSTQNYGPLELLRNKSDELFVYAGFNFTEAGKGGKSHIVLTKQVCLTSIYQPNLSNWGYGDMRGTSDALIFDLSNLPMVDGHPDKGAVLDVYVARGYSKNIIGLYNALIDGELDAEMEALRAQAHTYQEDEQMALGL